MRRTASLFATALLAAAAALTAPAAEAAPTAAQAAGPCYVNANPQGYFNGTCSGIDPMQTWHMVITCVYTGGPGGPYVIAGSTGGWVTGNTTTWASCGLDQVNSVSIQFGPTPAGGPTGQITGFMNKCLDVRMGTSVNGTPVQMWDCLGNVNQSWRIASDGTIRAVGLCLDTDGGRTDNGTPVQIWECNGAASQQWQVRADGAIINVKSGRALDVRGFDTANGAAMQIWDFNNTANQLWHAPA